MRSKELWLVQENHATVKLDSSVAFSSPEPPFLLVTWSEKRHFKTSSTGDENGASSARQNERSCAVIAVLFVLFPVCIILRCFSFSPLIWVQVSSWTSNSKPSRSNASIDLEICITLQLHVKSLLCSQVSHISSASWYRTVCFSAVVAFIDTFLACSCPVVTWNNAPLNAINGGLGNITERLITPLSRVWTSGLRTEN